MTNHYAAHNIIMYPKKLHVRTFSMFPHTEIHMYICYPLALRLWLSVCVYIWYKTK